MKPPLSRLLWFVLACGVITWAGLYYHFMPRDRGGNRAAAEFEAAGDAYFRAGAPDQAVAEWRRALDLDPGRQSPYEKISSYYIVSGAWDRAAEILNRGLTCLPGCANLYFNLGLSSYLNGDYALAEENLQKVSRLDEYYPDVNYMLGLVYRSRGDEARAGEFFVREINVNPGSHRAWKEVRKIGAAGAAPVSADNP